MKNPLIWIVAIGAGLFLWAKSKAATAAATNPLQTGLNLLGQYQAGTLNTSDPATVAAINSAGGTISALGTAFKNLLGPVAPNLNNGAQNINNSPAADAIEGNDAALNDLSYSPFFFDGGSDQTDPFTGTLG